MSDTGEETKNEDSGKEANQKNEINDECRVSSNHCHNVKKSDSDDKHSRSNSRTTSQQNNEAPSRSRSRSPTRPLNTQWKSRNPFINFMQDFRQQHIGLRSAVVFRLAGEKWRRMSVEEKQPYINAAKLHKQQDTETSQNEPDSKGTSKKPEKTRKEQRKQEKKHSPQTRRKNDSDTESDSATSGTAGSATSDDVSDQSS